MKIGQKEEQRNVQIAHSLHIKKFRQKAEFCGMTCYWKPGGIIKAKQDLYLL